MADVDIATETAFEAYYERQSASGNACWLYLGFASLICSGIFAGMILEWQFDGEGARFAPGESAPGVTQYVTVSGVGEVELKVLEYAGLFVAMAVMAVCYTMAAH